MIKSTVLGFLMASFIGQVVFSKPANALSCRNRQEISRLISTVADDRYGARNIVEALIEEVIVTLPLSAKEIRERQREGIYVKTAEIDVIINRVKKRNNKTETAERASQNQEEIDKLRQIKNELIQSIGLFDPAPQREVTITFEVKTLEVFKGEAISRFVLMNTSANIAGAADIGRCVGGQDMHVNLDRMYYEDTKPAKGLYKSGDKPNPLSGFPWHSCSHYKSLKGQRVILLGKGQDVLCTDGIIEIEALTNPDLLREFIRCAGPAAKRAAELQFGDSVKKGLPGKLCLNKNGSVNSTKLWGGKCSPGERRLSWLEERLGQFVSPVRLSVMMSCPNPLSVQ